MPSPPWWFFYVFLPHIKHYSISYSLCLAYLFLAYTLMLIKSWLRCRLIRETSLPDCSVHSIQHLSICFLSLHLAPSCFLVQFSSTAQLCPTLCDPMDCSTPEFPVHHQLPELTQTRVHRVADAIQPSHPLSSPSPPAFNLSQHRGLFQWVHSWHQVTKVLEFQLQHQSFQWIFRSDFL